MAHATTAVARSTHGKPFYHSLYVQVLTAIAVGIALGHFYPEIGEQMKPLGDAFIKVIKMIIAPIIFCTVVHGIASMQDMKKVGRVGLKALIYFEVLTTLALDHRPHRREPAAARRRHERRRARASTPKRIEAYVAKSQGPGHDRLPDEHHSRTPSSAHSRRAKFCRCCSSRCLFGFALQSLGERGKAAARA